MTKEITKFDLVSGRDFPLELVYNLIGDKREYLGSFDDPMSAFEVYKEYKEQAAKDLANKHKDFITERDYEKLLQYNVQPF